MTNKDTVYEIVTTRIVEMLEAGTVPWQKPWTAASAPRSIEGHAYKGINVFILAAAGYQSPFWLTFNQARKRGGAVRKGEKSTLIVFWKFLRVQDEETQETKTIPMLRYYRVFNLEQTDGVKLPKAVAEWQPPAPADFTGYDRAQAIVDGYPSGPSISETGAAAFYRPSVDAITVPPRSAFSSADEFYSTLFHEIGHSTGHGDRLARKGVVSSDGFGGHVYGREELVAEMTSAFLCAEAGITVTHENSAAYLASWVRTIKEDVRAVVVAAGAAQRAADYVLGRTPAVESDQPVTEVAAAA